MLAAQPEVWLFATAKSSSRWEVEHFYAKELTRLRPALSLRHDWPNESPVHEFTASQKRLIGPTPKFHAYFEAH